MESSFANSSLFQLVVSLITENIKSFEFIGNIKNLEYLEIIKSFEEIENGHLMRN